MTVLDWAIVAFTIAFAMWGYRQGLIVGLLTLLGFLAGAVAGSRAGPLLLSEGSSSAYAPLFAALGALLVGSLVAVTLESLALGLRERLIRGHAVRLADGAGGAALVAVVALGLIWVFGAVALHAPSTAQLRSDVQRSLILRRLNDLLPPSGPILNALNRVDPAPSFAGPTGPVATPDPSIAADPDVRRASRSVVRVLGTACGLGVEGSGWVAAPGLVITNAHVVAGEDDTTVTTIDGASLDATPVRYDPANDLALLRIDAPVPPLEIAPDPQRGSAGAVLGYPENGPYAVAPARIGDTNTVVSEDSYGNGPIQRSIAFLRGSVRSGNSGGPLVDSRGRVMATVFAATTSGPLGGFAVPNDVVSSELAQRLEPVDTGGCTG
ncbi:MAG TPA: MarP family serine protease [Solirubrobacterales bacterium]|nr:MarP family serine protease [Solirubrobacterales bacterium]